MKQMLAACAALAIVTACAASAQVVGQPAPNFKLPDANGKPVSLSDFRGKTVVIEWNNPECPFVKKHYGSGNMQRTQAAAAKDGVVWLTINSSAPGNQGYVSGAGAKAVVAQSGGQPTAYLLDPNGVAGKAFGAKTTPHMYIVNKAGSLVYAGGIDDKPTPNPADIAGARNHVLAALSELKAGKAISVPTSRPYGCAVKYKDS
ncbi:thioredoxin family protein [Leptolyngbya sp. 15MV]|nr:thioredoxin family protein [Leptolyngbya sp. 15MV]